MNELLNLTCWACHKKFKAFKDSVKYLITMGFDLEEENTILCCECYIDFNYVSTNFNKILYESFKKTVKNRYPDGEQKLLIRIL